MILIAMRSFAVGSIGTRQHGGVLVITGKASTLIPKPAHWWMLVGTSKRPAFDPPLAATVCVYVLDRRVARGDSGDIGWCR